MSRLNRICISTLIVCIALFANPASVLAIPSLPSSFYGTLKLNNANVADGTVVQAFNADKMIAQGYSQTYQGDSVYSLDVPGDNTDTTVSDGGREGDTLTFKVGGLLATQTGIWHSATNVQLNLTVTSAATLMPPQATPTHIATQTQIVVIQQPSKTATLTVLASATTRVSTLDAVSPALPISTPGQTEQLVPVTGDQENGSDTSPGITILIIAIVVLGGIAAGLTVWTRRKNNMKDVSQ